jgi:hypothetical protein
MSLIRTLAAAALLTFAVATPVLAASTYDVPLTQEAVDSSYVFNTNEDGPN